MLVETGIEGKAAPSTPFGISDTICWAWPNEEDLYPTAVVLQLPFEGKQTKLFLHL